MVAKLGHGKPRKHSTVEDIRARHLAERVVTGHGCWEWQGHRDLGGYGRVGLGYSPKVVHRLAYELFVGPIPGGLCVMHRCKTRRASTQIIPRSER
ncbi:MAG: HNH endonuclease [Thermoleophilia bacterium]|nr:HNH endonuclease [Thermoleophilia bacterium]